jgi:hypothetical protein
VAFEGVALIGYAGYLVVSFARFGITGPADVSNVPAVVLEIVIFALFGAGLLFAARALWQVRRGGRGPAVLAQIIAAVVGGPLAFSAEAAPRIAGILVVTVAVVTVIALLSRGVTRELIQDEA